MTKKVTFNCNITPKDGKYFIQFPDITNAISLGNNLAYFNRVHTNGFNIEWPNGQDICPDDLYYNSIVR